MLTFSCNHRFEPNTRPRPLRGITITTTTTRIHCLCKPCHLSMSHNQTRTLFKDLMRQLDELDASVDEVTKELTADVKGAAAANLDLFRLHARRKEAKESYKGRLNGTWDLYNRRWGSWRTAPGKYRIP